MKPTCATCRYCDEEQGLCRRNAPVAYMSQSPLEVLTWWPQVDMSDWCGEWAPELPEQQVEK